jgi:scyllo-inositol 2-dehydrogenase (NADP+)
VHLVLGYGRLRVLLHAGMEVREPGPRFEVHGDRGSFLIWGLDRPEVEATLVTEVAGLELRGRLAGVPGDHRAFYAAMAAAVAGEGPVPVTAAEARDSVMLIEHALRSSREGRRVPVEAAT